VTSSSGGESLNKEVPRASDSNRRPSAIRPGGTIAGSETIGGSGGSETIGGSGGSETIGGSGGSETIGGSGGSETIMESQTTNKANSDNKNLDIRKGLPEWTKKFNEDDEGDSMTRAREKVSLALEPLFSYLLSLTVTRNP